MNAVVNPVVEHVNGCAANARLAWKTLRHASADQKVAALEFAASEIERRCTDILAANAIDMAQASAAGRDAAYLDRLALTDARVSDIAAAVRAVAKLPDPTGKVLMSSERPSGMKISRVSVPIGVIGMIFESRPNVAADASALCIKSGNAIVLRGGSDSTHSVALLVACMKTGLERAGLPGHAVETIAMNDRVGVTALLRCSESIDLVIPRGGKGLVELVMREARVPTLQHLDGNCHTYIHGQAAPDKAIAVLRNAKLRRTGICGATESLVIDVDIAVTLLPQLLDAMPACEFRGDERSLAIDGRMTPATADDFAAEYLTSTISVKVVDDIEQAIAHVDQYSSGHTDAIITESDDAAARFLNEIDSAVVMHNTSTQFSDGGEFGMGAEIGIATGRLHARGPVGLEQLVTYKYCVAGNGQIRG